MNEVAGSSSGSSRDNLASLAALPVPSDDPDDLSQLEDFVDTKTCVALLVYCVTVVVVMIVACGLIISGRFYAGDVVLCTVIALYELSILQVVALTVARRRGASISRSLVDAAGVVTIEPRPGAAREMPLLAGVV